MYVNRKAMKHLKEGLELLKCGRAHQARFFIQVAIEAIERKAKDEEERSDKAA
jgi:hypothetical protein